MIGKIIAGSSFAGTVGYVIKEQSRILAAEGITPPDVREMVQDFKDQTLLNPRIKNAVGHISLSFSPKDTPCMTDALMLNIAKEYMQRMGITDTQYLLVRHLDQPHPHCHLVYNRVGNDGQTISIIRKEGFLAEFYPDSPSWNYGKAFILSNGVGVNIYNGCLAIIPNYHPPKKVHVKRNNLVIGKDVFWFNSSAGTLSELKDYSGLMPMKKSRRSKLTRDDLITRCKSNNMDTALIACSQLFIEDGFEFKKDYPIRF